MSSLGSAGSTTTVPGSATATSPELRRSLRNGRSLANAVFSFMAIMMTLLAGLPLLSLIYMVIVRGGEKLRPELLFELPPAAGMPGGGIGNALAGSALMVAIASAIAIPIGISAAIYIAEFAPESRLSAATRFAAKLLTGIPSILAGVFAYAVIVLTMGKFSAWAGGFALAILMIPTVLLTAADAIRGVPARMREAAIGMGATRFQVVSNVVLPTAMPVLLTGVMLAIARVAGETAPLIFTALFFDYWPHAPFVEPTASLPVLIYNFSGVPYPEQIGMAWAASLVLVIFVLIANLAGQFVLNRARSIR